ncbi:MAG: ATP-binding protein [Prevotella sp.]|nr:ATP-binding protein [Prevotella sp.]
MLYPIGIQGFETVITDGFVYVDKTAQMYDLISSGRYYFLSRPRRFGKSLLVSTMKAYFEGKKELFKGLAIEKLEKEWKQYPVLYLDLNTGKYDTLDNLESNLNTIFAKWERIYGSLDVEDTFESRLKGIIERAYENTKQKVVILVDEYDKPILTAIDNAKLQDQFRQTLKSIYSVLKTQSDYIRFGFLTGVSKFSHMSVFSDLNNLEDITLKRRYADICGISEKELHTYFKDSIKELAEENSMTYDETCAELEKLYDGYHFAPNSAGMYNPFSLLNTLKSKEFGKYWYRTGTPTFLVKMLQKKNYNLNNLQNETVTAEMFDGVESLDDSPIPLLYQCGYLTITGYDKRFDKYHLGFPNLEVEQGFTNFLLPFYIRNKDKKASDFLDNFVCDVEEGRPERFLSSMKTLLDGNDYSIIGELEKYFQNVMCLIFKLMGFHVDVEYKTATGRIDAVIKTKDYIYLMELKVDTPAEKALEQIETKDYAKVFAADERKLYKIGVSFSSTTRSISEYKIEAPSNSPIRGEWKLP